jgi:16S rRNA (uracil1498-N3)-methyltransferase
MSRTIRTFFDPLSNETESTIHLDEIESHHLLKVLRLGEGDEIEALNGQGDVYKVKIENVAKKSVRLAVLDKRLVPRPEPFFQMGISLLKGNRWEDMIRPLTELGVGRLFPLLTDRTEAKLRDSNVLSKIQKWEKIAREACKQSGNPWMPIFDTPKKFSTYVEKMDDKDAVLFGSLSPFAKKCEDISLGRVSTITVFIGPEGGWSQGEENLASESGFSFFTLGKNTLRVETAALSGLAVARERFIV